MSNDKAYLADLDRLPLAAPRVLGGRGDREAIARLVDALADAERMEGNSCMVKCADLRAILALPSAIQPPERGAVEAGYNIANSHQIVVGGECIAFASAPWTDRIVDALSTPATNPAGEAFDREVRGLRAACQEMEDDYQLSAGHHPDHALVPLSAFQRMGLYLRTAAIAELHVTRAALAAELTR